MPMYTLAMIPLIKTVDSECRQAWYAGDAVAVGKIADLNSWWDRLTNLGPDFGYFPNATKTWLITQEDFPTNAISSFVGTSVHLTSEGRLVFWCSYWYPRVYSSMCELES